MEGRKRGDTSTQYPQIQTVIDQKPYFRKTLKDNLLVLLTVLAVAVGVVLGLSLRSRWRHDEYRKLFYLEFPGRILMNMIMMMIIPLTVSSLVTGMTNLGNFQSKNLGALAMAYYTLTTFLATVVGIVLVVLARPGYSSASMPSTDGFSNNTRIVDSLLDIISQCFPTNLVTACFQKEMTVIELVKSDRKNQTGHKITVYLEKPTIGIQKGTNVLGLVVFSIVLGLAINHVGDKGKPVADLFEAVNTITMVLMEVILLYLPIGIMCLVATQFIAAKDIWSIVAGLGRFMGVVVAGLVIHGMIALPLIYFFCTGKNPLHLAINTSRALATAFSTSSSSATLPVTMGCLINKCNLRIDVVRFLIPIGATINMDGTALYEAVAAIYVAQTNNWELGFVELCIVSLTATAGAVGAAGIPQAGLGTLVIVLTAVGLPIEDAVLLLSVDWLMDRLRTMVNVWGDCVGAGILDHRLRKAKTARSDQVLAQDDLSHEAVMEDADKTYTSDHTPGGSGKMTVESARIEMPASLTPSGGEFKPSVIL
ncbi:unnamed protein product [Candidula unifasciata]|uniref:Amino acid transporter n=1 Tax=Candidula unifasciata TaxID=100452 RepID=A0A8S3YDW5_9EUPU|nr:unnamed protein product [Candidula unifasciata]